MAPASSISRILFSVSMAFLLVSSFMRPPRFPCFLILTRKRIGSRCVCRVGWAGFNGKHTPGYFPGLQRVTARRAVGKLARGGAKRHPWDVATTGFAPRRRARKFNDYLAFDVAAVPIG